MNFSNIRERDSQGIPVLREKTMVRTELAEEDKASFQSRQYEICFFLGL